LNIISLNIYRFNHFLPSRGLKLKVSTEVDPGVPTPLASLEYFTLEQPTPTRATPSRATPPPPPPSPDLAEIRAPGKKSQGSLT
jgi:hypothetical protein